MFDRFSQVLLHYNPYIFCILAKTYFSPYDSGAEHCSSTTGTKQHPSGVCLFPALPLALLQGGGEGLVLLECLWVSSTQRKEVRNWFIRFIVNVNDFCTVTGQDSINRRTIGVSAIVLQLFGVDKAEEKLFSPV